MLSHMKRSGVRCLDVHTFGDNIMAKIADPTFLGEKQHGASAVAWCLYSSIYSPPPLQATAIPSTWTVLPR